MVNSFLINVESILQEPLSVVRILTLKNRKGMLWLSVPLVRLCELDLRTG